MSYEIPHIDKHGTKRWYNDKDQLHREGGLPACEYTNGNKLWLLNGTCVRFDNYYWTVGWYGPDCYTNK